MTHMEDVEAPICKDDASSGDLFTVQESFEVFLRLDSVFHKLKHFPGDRMSSQTSVMVNPKPFFSPVYLLTETSEIFNRFLWPAPLSDRFARLIGFAS